MARSVVEVVRSLDQTPSGRRTGADVRTRPRRTSSLFAMAFLVAEAASLIGVTIAVINAPLVARSAGADDCGRSVGDDPAGHQRSLLRRNRRNRQWRRQPDVAVA